LTFYFLNKHLLVGPDELLAEIKRISQLCNGKPFGVDILVHGAEGGVMKQLIDAFADGGAKVSGLPKRFS